VVKKLGELATYDRNALESDRKVYPEATHGPTGRPLWKNSEAARWLDIDMADGVHLQPGFKPMTLWASRAVYGPFKESIRQRIDQKKQDAKAWGRKTPGQLRSGGDGKCNGLKGESRRFILDPYVNDDNGDNDE
jgi:hypothetical protein